MTNRGKMVRDLFDGFKALSIIPWRVHLFVALWSCSLFALAFYQTVSAGASWDQVRWLGASLAFGGIWGISLSLLLIGLPIKLAFWVIVPANAYRGGLNGHLCIPPARIR